MNADCDSLSGLKNALSAGEITPAEVEQRLSAAIEAEYMKDQPRIAFINACEDLLREIRTEGALPFASRVEEDEAFILSRAKVIRRVSWPVWAKACAMAAALALLTVFSAQHGRFVWMTGETINDGGQYLLKGHEINLEFIQAAIADHQAETRLSSESLEEIIRFLGFVPQLPDVSGLDVQRTYYSVTFIEGCIKLTVNYELGPEKQKLLFTSSWFTDAEYAWFTLEQNAQGEIERIAGKDVYRYENVGMPGYAWSEGLAVHMLMGEVSREESRQMVEVLLLADHAVDPQLTSPHTPSYQQDYCKTSDYQEAAAFLGYTPALPDLMVIGAAAEHFEIYIEPNITMLSVLFRRADGSTVVYHVEHFGNVEEAQLTIYQNSEGTVERLGSKDVYFSMNYDKAGFTWWDGLTVYHLGGSIAPDAGREVVHRLIEEMH